MDEKQPVRIMIHNLNPWGGQDRSMLEIAWEMNRTIPLEIHAYSIEGYDNWPDMKHVPYTSRYVRPIVFKYWSYQKQVRQNFAQSSQPQMTTQSTGTASMISDIVQVQFVHHAWQEVQATLPIDKSTSFNVLKRAYHRWLAKYKLTMEKKAYLPHKQYIAISHTVKKQLVEHFSIPQENIHIVHHGVDTEMFCPVAESDEGPETRNKLRSELGFSEDDLVLLHVGALNARKGIFKTLETLRYLHDNGFDHVKFLAVGQGDQKVLQRKIESLQLQHAVTLVSHSKDIRSYYWAADLFFFPSYYEPFGLVVLEAMSCGLPALTTSTTGAAELMTSDEAGLLFHPEDSVQKVAEKILPALKSPELRQRMAEESRKIAEAQTWKKVGNKYRRFYRDYFRAQQENDI